MRAVQVTSTTGPGGVEVRDVAEPAPGPGDVLIEVHSVGVSFPDLLLSKGQYQLRPDPPFTLGVDAAGVVVVRVPTGSPPASASPRVLPHGAAARAGRRARRLHLPAARRAVVRRGRGAADELPDRRLRAASTAPASGPGRPCWSTAPPEAWGPPPSRSPRATAPGRSRSSRPRRRRRSPAPPAPTSPSCSTGFKDAVLDADRRPWRRRRRGRGRWRRVHRLAAGAGPAGPAAGRRLRRRPGHPGGQGQPAAAQQHRRPRRRLGCLRDDAAGLHAAAVGASSSR